MPVMATTIAYAFGSGTISSTAVLIQNVAGLTLALVDQADRARISIRTNPISYRHDGTAPAAGVGLLGPSGSTVIVEGNDNIKALQFIRDGAADATLSVVLERI